MLRANGETIDGPRPCDWFDIFVDDQGDLVALLLDVASSAESLSGFLLNAMRSSRAALLRHESLHAVVSGLEMQLAAEPGTAVGLVILRVSARDAKVELLNAGMPAVAHASASGQLELYPALSGAVGRRVGEVHPYELLPLVWGGTWLAVSDGMLNGSLDGAQLRALCAKLDLASQGLALAGACSADLYEALHAALSGTRFLRDDATSVLVSTDTGTRFKSGMPS